MRRGPITVVAHIAFGAAGIAVGWLLFSSWWVIVLGLGYLALDALSSEFWFRRRRTLLIGSTSLAVPWHWWGGVFRLVWPLGSQERIPFHRIQSIQARASGTIRIEYWAPDSADRLLENRTCELAPVDPEAVTSVLRSRVPEAFAQR